LNAELQISPPCPAFYPGIHRSGGLHCIVKSTTFDEVNKASKAPIYSTFKTRKNVRPQGKDYWRIVKKWEDETGKSFEDIIGELRKKMSPDEVIETLGVSRGFIYYHFSHAMNKIKYIENQYKKPLHEIIASLKEEEKTMNQISKQLGLAVTTLYNHSRITVTSSCLNL